MMSFVTRKLHQIRQKATTKTPASPECHVDAIRGIDRPRLMSSEEVIIYGYLMTSPKYSLSD